MENNRGGELFAIFLFLVLSVVLLSPFISMNELFSSIKLPGFDGSVTGAATFYSLENQGNNVLTSIQPKYVVITFLTIGLLVGIAEIQARSKKKK